MNNAFIYNEDLNQTFLIYSMKHKHINNNNDNK